MFYKTSTLIALATIFLAGCSDTPETATPLEISPPSGAPVAAGGKLRYPLDMYKQGLGGYADVDCTVTIDGLTKDCFVSKSTTQSFAEAALEFVSKARYKPATRNGVPVEVYHHKFHIVFSLK